MCIMCQPSYRIQLTHREVPIKLIQRVHETKQYIKSNGETVLKVEWFQHLNYFIGYITFQYFDGYENQTDAIQVTVSAN